jgi:hypothetical protein
MSTTESERLVRRLVSGDPDAGAALCEAARVGSDPVVLAAAALSARHTPALLTRAMDLAQDSRQRQIVAVVAAHLAGDAERVDALAREHLVDHPDSVLVAWIAAEARSGCTLPPSLSASSPTDPLETP